MTVLYETWCTRPSAAEGKRSACGSIFIKTKDNCYGAGPPFEGVIWSLPTAVEGLNVIFCTMVIYLFRAQRGSGGHPVRRLCVRAGVTPLARRHQRDEHGGPERVLERPLARHGQLARHALERQRRRHWVRWVRCFVDVDCTRTQITLLWYKASSSYLSFFPKSLIEKELIASLAE